jgi:outer membrane receptor protein involved in Fe transport
MILQLVSPFLLLSIRRTHVMRSYMAATGAILMTGSAFAQHAAQIGQPGEVVITALAGLPGLAVDSDRLPVASVALTAGALRRGGSTSLLGALDTMTAGVTLDQAQGNPFQPNLLYRGYEASPLGGNAQGLAVYVDGARFNQPFGDTMNWDLIPDIAVSHVTLEGSSPVFGLNALGGAVSIGLKTGREYHGVGGETSIGRFEGRAVATEAGLEDGSLSAYLAASVSHDDGWREHSPSSVRQVYAQVGAQGDWGRVGLRLLVADTSLTGNGTSPVELLDADYAAVFTYPDQTKNRFARALLSADLNLGPRFHLKPNLYVEHLRQHTANGDLSDAEACDSDDDLLCLDGDDDAPVTDAGGTVFPAFNGEGGYAQLNATDTSTTGYGGSLQLQGDLPLGALANRLVVGTSLDGGRIRFSANSTLGVLTGDRGFGDPQGVIDMTDGPIRSVRVTTRRTDIGLFAADMLSPTRDVDVTIAARYNHAHVSLNDRIGTALDGRHDYARLNPSLGVVWRIGGLALYGDYAEANRAPTPAELSCASPDAPCSLSAFFVDDPDLHQVVSHTFEGGVRGSTSLTPTAHLTWRVGGWRSTNDHDIVFAAAQTIGRAYFRNVGTTRRQGIETEAALETPLLSVNASYVLTDATFRTGFVSNSPDNPEADGDGLIEVQPGDRVPGIARNRIKGSVTRRFGKAAWLTAEAQYSSGRWLMGDEANLTYPTRGYWLANLAAGVRPVAKLELFAEVQNLFDRRYATFGGFTETNEVNFAEAPGIDDPRAVSPGTPRGWRIGARMSF